MDITDREISRKIVTARKRHKCDYCHEWIDTGEMYISATIVDDEGTIIHRCYHIDCDKITKSLNLFADFMSFDSFEETINYYIDKFHKNFVGSMHDKVKKILKELTW